MINMKYNRVFFAQTETDSGSISAEDPVIPAGSKIIKKKRNLVALSTPLIIKPTPYEKERTFVFPKTGEEVTSTVTFYKTNKSFNQILDAYLMDRTIKLYREQEETSLDESITNIAITAIVATESNINFHKTIKDKKTLYVIDLDLTSFYSFSPDTYMTTEVLKLKDENEEGIPIPQEPSPGASEYNPNIGQEDTP